MMKSQIVDSIDLVSDQQTDGGLVKYTRPNKVAGR